MMAIERPLVVIDPEDAEQVERLTRCLMLADGDNEALVRAALREFANPTPPRPAEPTGLGAVVEDIDGLTWLRCPESRLDSMPWINAGNEGWRKWEDIDPARVIWEGVES